MARVSLFAGGVRPLPESGRPTGMYKRPVAATLALGVEGFDGDTQADRRVHGGPEKALHLYPAAHYAALAAQFPQVAASLVPGSIGENLSTADLDERDVRIGDVWRLGTAQIQVCQPRNPCWKIDERYGCAGMAAFIVESRITGWYWRVLCPGEVRPGDPLELLEAASRSLTLHDALRLWRAHRSDPADLARLAALPGIAVHWKHKIDQRIAWLAQNATA